MENEHKFIKYNDGIWRDDVTQKETDLINKKVAEGKVDLDSDELMYPIPPEEIFHLKAKNEEELSKSVREFEFVMGEFEKRFKEGQKNLDTSLDNIMQQKNILETRLNLLKNKANTLSDEINSQTREKEQVRGKSDGVESNDEKYHTDKASEASRRLAATNIQQQQLLSRLANIKKSLDALDKQIVTWSDYLNNQKS